MEGAANGLLLTGEGPGHIVGRRPEGRARAMADTMSGEEGAQGPGPGPCAPQAWGGGGSGGGVRSTSEV